MPNKKLLLIITTVLLLCAYGTCYAADESLKIADLQRAIDTVWLLFAAFLVFWMQAGFGLVEAGFTRAKNAANILMKNFMDFSVASIAYWAVGFAIMFGVSAAGIVGKSGFFLAGNFEHLSLGVPKLAYWIFQVVFASAIAAMLLVWVMYGKPDASMTMNGSLAGLVAITSSCDSVAPISAIIIGMIGGVIVVLGVALLDKVRVDDPVGAIPVHGMNGVWGTLAVGLFHESEGLFLGGGISQLGVQAFGIISVFLFVTITMGLVFLAIKKTIGLRVSPDEEAEGLDLSEHSMESYPDFRVTSMIR